MLRRNYMRLECVTLVDSVLAESLHVHLTVRVQNFWFGTGLENVQSIIYFIL